MNLELLEREVAAWQDRNFPNTPAYRPLLGAVEELGELAHAHLKNEQGIRGTAAEHADAKLDAVGDICIYLIHYARLSGFSLATAIGRAWAEVQYRDWVKNNATGVGTST